MTNIEKILEKFWKDIEKKPNVVGYSGKLKPKIVNGKPDPVKQVIRVYVSKKIPKSQLSTQDLIPASIPNGGDMIETDVIEIGEIKALGCYSAPPDPVGAQYTDGRQDKHRPLVIGPSAMGTWTNATACTLGGFAINKKAGEDEFVGILANNHCCAQENKAVPGTHYIQPSPYDGGGPPGDTVGTLHRFVPIAFNGFTCWFRRNAWKVWKAIMRPQTDQNVVDIGFVKLNEGIAYNVEVHNIGTIHGKREAVTGDTVAKFGRTTGLTTDGTVMDPDWSGKVAYSRGTVFFRDCLLVVGDKFSQGGDSSSFTFAYEGNDPATSTNREYIGNLFAGSDTHSIICKYGNVERELEVEVLV